MQDKPSLITDPNRLSRDSIVLPDEDKLKQLITKTADYVYRMNKQLDDSIAKSEHPHFVGFMRRALSTNFDLVLTIVQIPSRYLNSHHILMRTHLETMVDFMWAYDIYRQSPQNGEELAKRFFQLGAVEFLYYLARFRGVQERDGFIRSAGKLINLDTDEQKANRSLQLTTLVDPNANRKLQKLQKQDWRALPNFVKVKEDISFKARAKVAARVAFEVTKLKAAPYQENWDLGNWFVHCTSHHYAGFNEAAPHLYRRNLNILLGFTFDMLWVCYHFIGIKPPEPLRAMTHEFIWTST